jgi:hypothetical protein
MGAISVAGDVTLIDDAGHEFRLQGHLDRRGAARELKRGARVGVVRQWGLGGAVDWPQWAKTPPRGSTAEAERWLSAHEAALGNDVDFTVWLGEKGTVLLAWAAC